MNRYVLARSLAFAQSSYTKDMSKACLFLLTLFTQSWIYFIYFAKMMFIVCGSNIDSFTLLQIEWYIIYLHSLIFFVFIVYILKF